jgi:micrococcal nuclease
MRLLLAILVVVALPANAEAASCADYRTQADAQRAADTRDGDGDGVLCEALPCPCEGKENAAPGPAPAPARVIDARVTSVTDGDTIRVRELGGAKTRYRVRLIGIDTPETDKPGTPVECGARKATAYMEKLAGRRRVTLRTDPTQDTFDRYGRLLAHVATRDGKSLQIGMLEAGWAKTYVYQHRAFAQLGAFRAAEQRARSHMRGVWGRCGSDFHAPA